MIEIAWVFRLDSEDHESTLVPVRPFSTFRESICVGPNDIIVITPAKSDPAKSEAKPIKPAKPDGK